MAYLRRLHCAARAAPFVVYKQRRVDPCFIGSSKRSIRLVTSGVRIFNVGWVYTTDTSGQAVTGGDGHGPLRTIKLSCPCHLAADGEGTTGGTRGRTLAREREARALTGEGFATGRAATRLRHPRDPASPETAYRYVFVGVKCEIHVNLCTSHKTERA